MTEIVRKSWRRCGQKKNVQNVAGIERIEKQVEKVRKRHLNTL